MIEWYDFSSPTGPNVSSTSSLPMGPSVRRDRNHDEVFAQVEVDPEIGTIVWPNGADLDPDDIRGDQKPVNPARYCS